MTQDPAHPAEIDARIEHACEVMHDAYEAAAVTEGWETQERSRKPWADVPEANKRTMRAAVSALADAGLLRDPSAAAIARAAWYEGAQAATDWIKSGAWLGTMPDNPHGEPITPPVETIGAMPWPEDGCDHSRATCEEVGCPNAATTPPEFLDA